MEILNFDNQKNANKPANFGPFRAKMHQIIFEAETPAGKTFDVVLLLMILLSTIVLMLETVPSLQAEWGSFFYKMEWAITIFFTIEYICRLYCVYKPILYAKSFFGIIDIVSILPVYLDLIFPGVHSLLVIRGLRLLRIFRIFKLDTFLNQGNVIISALKESWPKMTVFLFFIIVSVCIFGSVLYLIEHTVNPQFESIPISIYWAIVTITTVGYGDISPITGIGKFVASVIMILGYSIIAVPTGIVTSAIINANKSHTTISCNSCGTYGHDDDAAYCKYCGGVLE
jgi:voltage-gated potassium channel